MSSLKPALRIGFALNWVFAFAQCNQLAEWTVLTYMQANNDLALWAHYSFSHMQAGIQKTAGTHVLVQHLQEHNQMMVRYKMLPGEMKKIESFARKQPLDLLEELVESMRWVHQHYPAKKYLLSFWNHGTGILDYDENRQTPVTPSLRFSPRLIQRHYAQNIAQTKIRGILYDQTCKRSLSNQDLAIACERIKNIIGQKIDIVIMDACFMAMFEVGYQIKDSAQILIASQEWESGEGIPFAPFLYTLTCNHGLMNPIELAKLIVHGCDLFYKYKEGSEDYTFSAVDLSGIEQIRDNISHVLELIKQCAVHDPADIKLLIKASRARSHAFFWEDYLDLYSFYDVLWRRVVVKMKTVEKVYLQALRSLSEQLQKGKHLIAGATIANVYGSSQRGAHGISIYYPIPNEEIHESYFQTHFARDCQWPEFIAQYR